MRRADLNLCQTAEAQWIWLPPERPFPCSESPGGFQGTVTHHHHLSELSRCFSGSALGMVFQPLHALLWPWPCVEFSMQIHTPTPQRLYSHQWLQCLIQLPLPFPRFSQELLLLSVYFAAPWATWAWLGRATSWQDSKESSPICWPSTCHCTNIWPLSMACLQPAAGESRVTAQYPALPTHKGVLHSSCFVFKVGMLKCR